MLDRFVYGTVSRISPEAPVPVLAVTRKTAQPGGAANTAVNVASLGGKVELFGVIGKDQAGVEAVELLTQRRVGVEGVIRDASRPSTVKTRIVALSQQVVRIDEERAEPLDKATASQLMSSLEQAVPALELLIVSDYSKGIVSEQLAAAAVSLCRSRDLPVVVDPKPANAAFFAGADVIKPNLGEALRLAGREAGDDGRLEELCFQVAERSGIPGVVVTAGAQGMYVLESGEVTHLTGVAREVYDVAGAGDSVLAALALGLAAGLSLTDAARLGNLAGSIAVGHLGIAAVTADELCSALLELPKEQANADF